MTTKDVGVEEIELNEAKEENDLHVVSGAQHVPVKVVQPSWGCSPLNERFSISYTNNGSSGHS